MPHHHHRPVGLHHEEQAAPLVVDGQPPTLLRDPSEGALPTREVVTDADALHRSQTEEHDELVEKAAREALAPL